MNMIDYYNTEIPDTDNWRKIDCQQEGEYFKAICQFCSAIDNYIPDLIALQEKSAAATTIAITAIMAELNYTILPIFLNDFTTAMTATVLGWSALWTASVLAAAATGNPLPVTNGMSTIGETFKALSVSNYSGSESIIVFGDALDAYVLKLMSLNTQYGVTLPDEG